MNDNQIICLIQKTRHLKTMDAANLYHKMSDKEEWQYVKLTGVQTYDPVLLKILFWSLPGFAPLNRFFSNQYVSGTVQLIWTLMSALLALGAHFSIAFYQSLAERGVFAFIIIVIALSPFVWLFYDGLTMMQRTKEGNYRRIESKMNLDK